MQSAQEKNKVLDHFHKAVKNLLRELENGLILCGKCGIINIVKKLTASLRRKFDLKENVRWQRKLF